MSNQGRDRRINARLVGAKRLDRDTQRRMFIPVTLIAVVYRRATSDAVGMFATSNPRIAVHRNPLREYGKQNKLSHALQLHIR
jgi:hypothetical protein